MDNERLKKAPDPNRANRASEDRGVTENRVLSDADRLDMFRQSLFNAALPNLPEIPGYHVCWCTTTNPRDTIHGRLRLGYEPITPEDVPGWESVSIKTGEYAGMIGVNEMLALKLPHRLYQMYMGASHHDAPLSEEEKLQHAAELIKEQAARAGAKATDVYVEEGFRELRNTPPPRPRFAG